MNLLLDFTVIGDKTFDLFFSIPASLSIIFFLAFSVLSAFRGRV
jgi:hypothetical protein